MAERDGSIIEAAMSTAKTATRTFTGPDISPGFFLALGLSAAWPFSAAVFTLSWGLSAM